MSRLSLLNDSGRRAPRWPGACLVLLTSHPAPCAAAIFISSREDSSREERLFSRPVPISQAAPGARRPRDADNSDRIQSTGFIDGTELPKNHRNSPPTSLPPVHRCATVRGVWRLCETGRRPRPGWILLRNRVHLGPCRLRCLAAASCLCCPCCPWPRPPPPRHQRLRARSSSVQDVAWQDRRT